MCSVFIPDILRSSSSPDSGGYSRAGPPPSPPGVRSGNTKNGVELHKLNTALKKRTHNLNTQIPPLKTPAEMGIIIPWCNSKIAVLSAYSTRTGLRRVSGTPQPAAIVFPLLFYPIFLPIARLFSACPLHKIRPRRSWADKKPAGCFIRRAVFFSETEILTCCPQRTYKQSARPSCWHSRTRCRTRKQPLQSCRSGTGRPFCQRWR